MTTVAATLEKYFTDRLLRQRQVSPQTVASYRDSLQLLLHFVHDQCGKEPSQLDWTDLDEPVISAFLDHLQDVRGNSVPTRNLRLTAIRGLFRYGVPPPRTRRADPAGPGHSRQTRQQAHHHVPDR